MAHNSIFEKLTEGPNDPVGTFAYIFYKRQKVDYCKSFGGRPPTPEELSLFYEIAGLGTSIAAYRAQGEVLAHTFLNNSLEDLVERTKVVTRQDTLHRHMEAIKLELTGKLTVISQTMGEKRTVLGWARDITGNLLINLVSIFVIGALLLGYRFSGELQQDAEQKTGLGTSPPRPGNAAGTALDTGPATPR